jgi:hypothetical protein
MVYGRGWAHTGGWVQQGGSVTPGRCVGPQPSISRHVMALPSFILLHLSFRARGEKASIEKFLASRVWVWWPGIHGDGTGSRACRGHCAGICGGVGGSPPGESARTDLSLGSSRLWKGKSKKEKVKPAACSGRPSSSGSADLPEVNWPGTKLGHFGPILARGSGEIGTP